MRIQVEVDNGDIYEVRQHMIRDDAWIILSDNEFNGQSIYKKDCRIINEVNYELPEELFVI